MDGIVAERLVSIGDRVENVGGGGTMFRIVDNRVLDLTVTVPSPQLSGLRAGQPIEFTTTAVPGRTFTGKVMFINPSVEAEAAPRRSSRSAQHRRRAEERHVRRGHPHDGAARRLQVPRAALNWNVADCTADVFVVRDGRAEKRTVKTGTGTAAGAPVEITSGLAPGDRVVVRGGFALHDGDTVTVAAAQGS
jgi:multidrug efflux pump subunit AcrA (membrane-fusion protein)